MPRCLPQACALALAVLACAPLAHAAEDATATITSNTTTVDVNAPQSTREFPLNALRGILQVGLSPEAVINGRATRLAPGVRIRGTNNLLQLPGSVSGQKLLVHYTVDSYQLVKEVWVLRAEEAALPWPETPEQAATWRFDVASKSWIKPN
jgi:hypothetical protein